ncbi:MAG: carboxylating nicotinate-nucleotide diphosphorylase [Bdellovibrionales bacterium]
MNTDALKNLDSNILSLVQNALIEDLPGGDITTDALKIEKINGHARFVAKQDLVLSGTSFLTAAILLRSENTSFEWHFADGEEVLKGQSFVEIEGSFAELLRAERVALNFCSHFSGIATMTNSFVDKVKHTNTKILDTRKTTPGLRFFEKKAVVDGGGVNHRMNLSDAVMLKENHILAAGGMKKAVELIKNNKPEQKIEVETTSIAEVKQAVQLGVNHIMLDNMSNELMTDCLKQIPSGILTEASGNMQLERVQSVAELGLDFISVGAITHSAPVADISLLFDWTI